jgi:hypothetical protein
MMLLRVVLEQWRLHQAGWATGIGLGVLLVAWLRTLWAYHTPTGHRAPVRWYMGYNPPPIHEPAEWDLCKLNAAYPNGQAEAEVVE